MTALGSIDHHIGQVRHHGAVYSVCIEVRVEAFNAFNWFQWGQPGVSFNNTATFGQITSSSNAISPRVFQFALKYAF